MTALYLLRGEEFWAGCLYVGLTTDPPHEYAYPLLTWCPEPPMGARAARLLIHRLLASDHQSGWWYCCGDLALATMAHLMAWPWLWDIALDLEALRMQRGGPELVPRGGRQWSLDMLGRACYAARIGLVNLRVDLGELVGWSLRYGEERVIPAFETVRYEVDHGHYRLDTWGGALVDRTRADWPALFGPP